MMPIVLVLLAVTSALAAPSIPTALITAYNINELGVPSNVVDRAFETVDGGSMNTYTLILKENFVDLIQQPDARSQALGALDSLVTIAYLSTTLPGDSCASTSLIEAYVHAVRSGNFSGVRQALNHFFQRIGAGLDLLVGLTVNPESLRNAVGPGSGCAGGGRSYPFEAAWDSILSDSTPQTIGLLNEQYCTSKRLYTAFNSRSNSIASAVTALALSPSAQVVAQAHPAILNLLNVVANGGNPSQAVAAVKQALTYGCSKITL